MTELAIQVVGMSCGHCKQAVEKAVSQVGAVANVDLASGTVTVRYAEDQLSIEQIREAIEEQGYEVII